LIVPPLFDQDLPADRSLLGNIKTGSHR